MGLLSLFHRRPITDKGEKSTGGKNNILKFIQVVKMCVPTYNKSKKHISQASSMLPSSMPQGEQEAVPHSLPTPKLEQNKNRDPQKPCLGFLIAASVEMGIQVILLTKLVSQGNAGKQLAPLTLDGTDIKEHHKTREDAQEEGEGDKDLAALAVHVHAAEADVGQESKRQKETGHKATDVGKVVDPGQQAEGEEEQHHAQQLGECPPWLCQDLPALKEFHKQACQNAKLGTCRTHLGTEGGRAGSELFQKSKQHTYIITQWSCHLSRELKKVCFGHLSSVGQEDGTGQVPCDAAQDVDDGDTQPTSQLLYISQYCHLKYN